jgi:hypothetical protein
LDKHDVFATPSVFIDDQKEIIYITETMTTEVPEENQEQTLNFEF